MKIIKINQDPYLKKDVQKIQFESEEMPKIQLFNSSDVLCGNASSNIAIAFVYTWKQDFAPKKINDFFTRISNYAALTGYWRTTNGGRYVFANMLANPNINKLVVLVFDHDDNGHLLVDSLTSLWKNGIDKDGLIIGCNAPNPKFEQVPLDALERIRKQADLLVMKNLSIHDFESIEKTINALIQEPENAVKLEDLKKELRKEIKLEFHSTLQTTNYQLPTIFLYDDGIRFDQPYYIDLSQTAKNVRFEKRELNSVVGQSIQENNLTDAFEQVAAFVFKNGTGIVDQRGIITIECRSISITIMDPLQEIPKHFSAQYIKTYVDEFMNGAGEKLDDFAYTYHERIFKKWGDQVERAITALKKNPNTRRALISLWNPETDLENSSAPCLDFIWLAIRNNKLELHPVYRSHHLATVTEDGKIMQGEGAFVPNLYALGTLQDFVAKKLGIEKGPLVLTDFSGHLYVSKVKGDEI